MISPDKPSIEAIIHVLVPDQKYSTIVSVYISRLDFSSL